MQLRSYAVVLCSLLPVVGAAQVTASSALANAMGQADIRVHASSPIATLEAGESRAVFTGLVVSDPSQIDRKIRGVRIEFSDSGWNRVLYVDEGKLQPLKDVLDRLTVDLERLLPHLASRGAEGYLGSCEMRDKPADYPLHVSYCYSGSCSPALMITSPTRIQFTGRKPADVAAILGSAIDYLRTH